MRKAGNRGRTLSAVRGGGQDNFSDLLIMKGWQTGTGKQAGDRKAGSGGSGFRFWLEREDMRHMATNNLSREQWKLICSE